MHARPEDRYHLSQQPSRLKRALAVLAAVAILALVTLPAWGQGQPRFRMEPVAALCGSLDDHLTILDANDFEPVWIGTGSVDGALTGFTVFVRRNDASWMALVMRDTTACVIANGVRIVVPPPARGGE